MSTPWRLIAASRSVVWVSGMYIGRLWVEPSSRTIQRFSSPVSSTP